jgi:hypothetical protein
MIIDGVTLDPVYAYKLPIGSIFPRAIEWISTLSKDGIANLVLSVLTPVRWAS